MSLNLSGKLDTSTNLLVEGTVLLLSLLVGAGLVLLLHVLRLDDVETVLAADQDEAKLGSHGHQTAVASIQRGFFTKLDLRETTR